MPIREGTLRFAHLTKLRITQLPDADQAVQEHPIEAALQKMSIAAIEELAKGFAPPAAAKP